MDSTAIETAIRRAGSEAKLADAIGYSQVAVNKAKRRKCSAEMAMAIHRWTDGEISAAMLRPDLPWPYSRVTP